MKIRIHKHDIPLPPVDNLRLQQRLALTLGAYQREIEIVTVWLADLCGRAGQGLRRCLIEVRLTSGRFVIGETADSDPELGVERCLDRIARKLALSHEHGALAPSRPTGSAVMRYAS